MPDIATGEKAIAFGDFSYYWILDRKPLAVKVLNEKYTLESQIGFVAYELLDAKLIIPEAVKFLQLA